MADDEAQTTEIVETEEVEQNGTPPANQPDASPMKLIEKALGNGADIDVLERLFELQERQEKNEAKRAFDAAIADLRDDLPEIVKNREVSYESKGSKTEYKYEDLGSIVEAIKEPMSEHGLSHRWNIDQDENGRVVVTCILSHRLGHSEETSIPAPKDTSGGKNSIQAIGSTITYLQRYTLKAALGLAASYDDDGQAAGGEGSSSGGSDLTTDPDQCETPNFDGWEEWDVISDLRADKLVTLEEYLTGDKLEGKYAEENKAMRKAVLKEIKKRKEERDSSQEDEEQSEEEQPDQDDDGESESGGITDAAMNLAREKGVADPVLAEIDGSGEDGRILKSDVQQHLDKQEEETDSDSEDDDDLSLNDAMSTIMNDCSELIDDTPASIAEIRQTFLDIGVTESNLDRIIEHLTDIQAGEAEYEVEDEVIQLG